MRKKKIKILHVAQAAGGVDRYIRMLLKYLDKDDYNNFKSYLICAGGALAVSEIYSWMKNISNRSTTVSRLKHD